MGGTAECLTDVAESWEAGSGGTWAEVYHLMGTWGVVYEVRGDLDKLSLIRLTA